MSRVNHMEDVADDRMRELLQEAGWLRRLARSMVNDSATADDLAQDAWIIASRKAPTDGRPLRPWLSRVMLNLVRMRHRGARRRETHEEQTPTGTPATPEELYERVEMQRQLAEIVLALKPIYRDVVLMHFVEGRTSAEIGEALCIDAGTVRWRLKTAIEQMRAALDRHANDKRALWMAPMLRFAGSDSPSFSGAALALAAGVAIALVIGVVVVILAATGGGGGGTSAKVASSSTGEAPYALAAPTKPGASSSVPTWAPQPGVAGKRMAGVVMANGVPVGGARVLLHMIHHDEEPIRDVVTASDGTFDLGVQPAVRYMLGASAAGRTPALVEVDLREAAARDQIVLDLADCPAKVAGTISDASGGPIAHASVRLDKIIGTQSDDRGRYELCLRTSRNSIVVSADGYAMTTFDARISGVVNRDVTLVPEGTIIGKVVTTAGAAAANARVEVNGEGVGLTVMTRDDGTFQAPNLSSGQYRIDVDAPDLVGTSPPVVVRAGEVTTAPTIVLQTALTIRGKVTLDGQPLADARVWLGNQDRNVLAVSQTDGTFTISTVAPGEQGVAVERYRVTTPVTFVATPTSILNISVAPTASIAGRVTSGGVPVAGALVTCSPLVPALDMQTARDGTFVLTGLDGPACDLSAFSIESGRVSTLRHVTLRPGERRNLDVELVNGAAIDGVVVDETGAPVANAFVFVESDNGDSGESLTDATGKFHAPALINAATTVHLQVFATPSGGNAFPWVTPPAPIALADGNAQVSGVRLVVRREVASIRGRVVDEQSRPIADARVRAQGKRVMSDNTGPSARTDRDGRFVIPELPVGPYRLDVAGADGSLLVQDNVATGSDVTLTLVRAGAIEGTLVGFGASPRVVANDHTRGFSLGALLTGTQFRTFGLTPGTYLVTATGGGSSTQRVEVRAGETTHVELHSGGTARVDLVLRDHATGNPLIDVGCVATGDAFGYPTWWGRPSAHTDAAGKASITDAPVGAIRVLCFPTNGSMASAQAELAPNGTASVQLSSVAFRLALAGDPGFELQPFQLPIQVWRVRPDGPAAAQLAPGDQLLAVNGVDVTGLAGSSAQALIQDHAPGTSVVLRIKRGADMRTVSLTLQRL